MAKCPVVMKLRTCQPVDYKESAILKALKKDHQLIAEPKHDGVQLNLVVTKDSVKFLSRAGIEFDALTGITTQNLCKLMELYQTSAYNQYPQGFVVQGELMATIGNLCEPASTTAGILRRKEAPAVTQNYRFVIFAVLPLDEVEGTTSIQQNRIMFNVRAKTFVYGLQQLAIQAPHLSNDTDKQSIALEVVEQVTVYQLEDLAPAVNGETIPSLMGYYREQRAKGLEGIVAWAVDTPWHRGKKTGGWKIKPTETHDGRIVGFFNGVAEATEDLIVGFEVELEDGHVVNVDGLTDAMSLVVTNNPDLYRDAIVEVSCMERFANGSLRHPKFKALRGINDSSVKE